MQTAATVSPHLDWQQKCETVGRFSCVLTFVDGLLVLVGWILSVPILTTFLPGAEPTKPNTALALILSSVACALVQRTRGATRTAVTAARIAAFVLSALVIAIGTVTLAEAATGRVLGFDAVFISVGATPTASYSQTMSSGAGLTVIALGAAFMWLVALRAAWPVQLAAHLVLFSAVVPLAGYVYDSTALRATPIVGSTALPTALGFLAMSVALMTARAAEGVMRIFTSTSAGGTFARRAVVFIVMVPVAINWAELAGELSGWYPQRSGWMFDAGFSVVVLLGLSWAIAASLHARDVERQRLTEALRDSEERYRTLVNTAPDAVVVKNERRIEFVNAAAIRLIGASRPDEVVGRSPFAFVHPEERPKVESQLCALLETGGRLPIAEHRLLRLDGTVVTVEATASAVGVGGARLAQVIVRDVTRRKADEQALLESEERFRLIAETISEVFWMADVNIETMVYVSPAYERVWGRSRGSLYDHPRSFLEAIHPDDRRRVLQTLEFQKIGQPFDHEYRIVRPDGETLWIWDRGFPVIGNDGRIRHYVGVAQDITQRRHREQQLRESLERFELVARATNDAVWDFNVKTGVAWWDDTFYQKYGLPRDKPPSLESWASHIHPDDRPRVTQSFLRVLRGGDQKWTDEYRYRRADGSYADVVDRANIVRDADGRALRVSGVLEDISERLNLQMQLQQATKMEAIGRLAGGVAHDFNNLLTVIHGHASFISETENLTPDNKESAVAIVGAAERAASLTRQLLLFSRRQVLQRTHFDVTETIARMGKMLSRVIGEDLHLEFDLPSRPLFIYADADMFDQILLNLVVNARDAMARGGVLMVSAVERTVTEVSAHTEAAPGRYVSISVSDTGDGIPADVLPRIFEPFFSTKAAGTGTGLGLATVFGAVQQHSGWIDVESEVGEGTTFRVWLPLSESQEPSQSSKDAIPAARGTETVLLVEDDVAVLILMRTALERKGYRVLQASTAAEAVDVWRSNKKGIQIVVSDMVLPAGMSGRDLAAQLRQEHPDLKVLLVSGYSADFSGRAIKQQAGQYFLQKPFTPTHFVETVRECLDSVRG